VVVQLALRGTHLGPLHLPDGTLPPTGKRMDAPCCDVFELLDGKIKRFDCVPRRLGRPHPARRHRRPQRRASALTRGGAGKPANGSDYYRYFLDLSTKVA
jgi:hypothetical protein